MNESFDPFNNKYKSVEDLPEERQAEFVDVPEEDGGGFVRKEAMQEARDAKERSAQINKSILGKLGLRKSTPGSILQEKARAIDNKDEEELSRDRGLDKSSVESLKEDLVVFVREMADEKRVYGKHDYADEMERRLLGLIESATNNDELNRVRHHVERERRALENEKREFSKNKNLKRMRDLAFGEKSEGCLGVSGGVNSEREIKQESAEKATIRKYLSYQDVELPDEAKAQMLESSLNSKSAERYARELDFVINAYGVEKVEQVAEKMIKECEGVLSDLGISPSLYSDSETWAMWDIAKQIYYLKNPDTRDEGYDVGDPMISGSKYREIVNRHIGWEVYRAYTELNNRDFIEKLGGQREKALALLNKKAKENGTLSSSDLAELGMLVRD